MVKGTVNPACYKLTAEFIVLNKVDGAHGSFWIGRNHKGEKAFSRDVNEVIADLSQP